MSQVIVWLKTNGFRPIADVNTVDQECPMECLPQQQLQLLRLAHLRPGGSTPVRESSAKPMNLARWAQVQMLISAAVANEPIDQ